MSAPDVPARVRLRPLEAVAYRYPDDLRAIEALAGAPAAVACDGTATVACPVTGATVTLRPGMRVVAFRGDRCRVIVTSGAAYAFMYEEMP